MTSITDGITVVTPDLVLGYEADTDSRNVFHDILGRDDPDVSLAADTLRSGTLELFFLAEADALEAHAMHRMATSFTVTSTDLTSLNGLKYVRFGRMSIALDRTTQKRWILSVGFQEIA